ncbi:MAG TPA: peptidoglycan DD-metalloendopeptidase family protein [Oligoflexia bacterium]|nr:peptidoglycan DD-metalloendopeptidase family protein [Oligoflexia bacterium]
MAIRHQQSKRIVRHYAKRRRLSSLFETDTQGAPPPLLVRRRSPVPHRTQHVSFYGYAEPGVSLKRAAHLLASVLMVLAAALAILLLPGILVDSRPLDFCRIAADFSPPAPAKPRLEPSQRFSFAHEVRPGQDLQSIALKYGLPQDLAQTLAREAERRGEKQNSPLSLQNGQIVKLVLSSNGDFKRLSAPLEQDQRLDLERRRADGKIAAYVRQMRTEHRDRVAVGLVETSFAAAAVKAGVPYDIVDDLVDILGSKVSFHRDFQKGDRFTVIFKDKLLRDGKSHKSGPLLAAFVQAGSKEVAAIRYVGTDGKARYFDQNGELIENGFLRYPAKFSRISSSFTKSRFHPVLKYNRPHNGVDFAAPVGTPVRSTAAGTVMVAGYRGASGNMVKVRHSERYSTAYLHLSRLAKGLRKGSHVERGQVIGYVGSTGLSSGPHLHYSFFDNGRYVDPLKIDLPALTDLRPGLKIHREYLNRVVFTLRHYQKIDLTKSYFS